MLTDQIFHAPPLIGLGPEIFFAKDYPGNVNFASLNYFRENLSDGQFFRYIFVSVTDSIYGDQVKFLRTLRDLGIPFSDTLLADTSKMHSLIMAKKVVRTLDLIFAPEFSTKIFVPSNRLCSVDTHAALDALRIFHNSAESFTAAKLKSYAENIWQETLTRNYALLPRF